MYLFGSITTDKINVPAHFSIATVYKSHLLFYNLSDIIVYQISFAALNH